MATWVLSWGLIRAVGGQNPQIARWLERNSACPQVYLQIMKTFTKKTLKTNLGRTMMIAQLASETVTCEVTSPLDSDSVSFKVYLAIYL